MLQRWSLFISARGPISSGSRAALRDGVFISPNVSLRSHRPRRIEGHEVSLSERSERDQMIRWKDKEVHDT